MKRKPIAGYASRTEACMALHATGLNSRQISDKLGIEVTTVSALIISKLKRAGLRAPKANPLHHHGSQVWVSNDLLDTLAAHAARRSLSIEAMVTAVLGAVVDEGLVGVVLDDDDDDLPSQPQQVSA